MFRLAVLDPEGGPEPGGVCKRNRVSRPGRAGLGAPPAAQPARHGPRHPQVVRGQPRVRAHGARAWLVTAVFGSHVAARHWGSARSSLPSRLRGCPYHRAGLHSAQALGTGVPSILQRQTRGSEGPSLARCPAATTREQGPPSHPADPRASSSRGTMVDVPWDGRPLLDWSPPQRQRAFLPTSSRAKQYFTAGASRCRLPAARPRVPVRGPRGWVRLTSLCASCYYFLLLHYASHCMIHTVLSCH